ncbi:FAD-binding oxidoreductase [Kineosporia sp. NBRC 101731]|uniref:NAD(P)/FAD-dependent oxidoreductase n=1 Tax=Kineosporia sp. NBRC 101731 TaxID=3032199 RepID=UPI0024A09848|nr:FAD-binding oxidoreductase [Kineosporia sp. NBRC 101731]GLY32985.1 FAD-dependent oxidoreductase [Kineosporia sp. NBRC 101731]
MATTSSRAPRPVPPAQADVVVIGGGVMGLSTAYHLAAAGVENVVLLESGQLGSGSTGKAAGGVRALFSDEVNIRLGLRGLETLRRFGQDFGQDIDLDISGYLFLLDNDADLAAFEAGVELQNALGVPSRMIDVEEARRLSPPISPEGLRGALFSPDAGHCTPESVVAGYTGAARKLGVTILTGTPATGVFTEGGEIQAVLSPAGRIRTNTVICAAGAWSGRIADWAGVDLPVRPLRRQIAVTTPVADLPPDLPFTIDFGTSFYFHREGPGLLLGGTEKEDTWGFDQSPTQDWLDDLASAMAVRVPSLGSVGIRRGWAGLYEMTPDHNALIGEAPGLSRFLYCTGFSGHGFLMGPAAGEVMRDLYLGVTPSIDVSGLSAERFTHEQLRPEHNVI